jgi:hypothetical protein
MYIIKYNHVPLHQLNLYQITMLNEFPEKCQTKKVVLVVQIIVIFRTIITFQILFFLITDLIITSMLLCYIKSYMFWLLYYI